ASGPLVRRLTKRPPQRRSENLSPPTLEPRHTRVWTGPNLVHPVEEISGSGSLRAHRIPVAETDKSREHGPRAKVIFQCRAQRVVVTPSFPRSDDRHRVALLQSRSNHFRHSSGV